MAEELAFAIRWEVTGDSPVKGMDRDRVDKMVKDWRESCAFEAFRTLEEYEAQGGQHD